MLAPKIDERMKRLLEAQALAAQDADTDIELRYFVLLTEPGAEFKAKRNLKRAGYDPYVPQETVEQIFHVRSCIGSIRRKRSVDQPIFRGYLFLPLNLAWSFGPIHSTPGLRQGSSPFLRRPDGCYRIADDVAMERIRDAEHRLNHPDVPGVSYRVGDRVRVLNGPLSERIAVIERMDSKDRIQLLYDILGGRTYVSADDITSADDLP